MGCAGRTPERATPSATRRRRWAQAPGCPNAAERAASQAGQRQKRCSASSGSKRQCGHSASLPVQCAATRSMTTLPARTARSAPAASGPRLPLPRSRIVAQRSTPPLTWAKSARRAANARHWDRCQAASSTSAVRLVACSAGRHPQGAPRMPAQRSMSLPSPSAARLFSAVATGPPARPRPAASAPAVARHSAMGSRPARSALAACKMGDSSATAFGSSLHTGLMTPNTISAAARSPP